MSTIAIHPRTKQIFQECREQFPALQRTVDGQPAIYFDGPAGTQVPTCVADAIRDYMLHMNANHGGLFATSTESDQLLDQAHVAFAEFLGTDDPDEVSFGQNMTSLTFALSRAIAQTWNPGDEVVVTRLDHDANIAPWVRAARDRGVAVHYVNFRPEDCTLDMEDLESKLSDRTRLVAVGCASNATGGINPVKEIARRAHRVGAQVFLDAVHYTPHQMPDVKQFDCDFLACSIYKFFGPHVGVLWGRSELLKSLDAYKVRPAPDDLPGKWMTGTQSHEGIAGGVAALDYLADLGRQASDDASLSRIDGLRAAYGAIETYEQFLSTKMLENLQRIDGLKVWGIDEPSRVAERFPTFSITHPAITTTELARRLGQRGIFVWHGHYYAIELSENLGLEPEGMVRIGLVHYNTEDEVDRLIAVLGEILD